MSHSAARAAARGLKTTASLVETNTNTRDWDYSTLTQAAKPCKLLSKSCRVDLSTSKEPAPLPRQKTDAPDNSTGKILEKTECDSSPSTTDLPEPFRDLSLKAKQVDVLIAKNKALEEANRQLSKRVLELQTQLGALQAAAPITNTAQPTTPRTAPLATRQSWSSSSDDVVTSTVIGNPTFEK